MQAISPEVRDEGLEEAKRIAEEEEGIGRRPTDWSRWVIPTIAACWSLFQLATASFLLLDSTITRAIHLTFALVIIFLNCPMFKKPIFGLDAFSTKHRIPLMDFVLAALAAIAALKLAGAGEIFCVDSVTGDGIDDLTEALCRPSS